MQISKNGTMELANYEALSNTLYLDSVNVRTIGIGMTVSEIPDIKEWSWDKRLETGECVQMFRQAVVKYQRAVLKALAPGVVLTQAQFDALVSITYNIGIGGMAGSTFIKRINSGAPAQSVVESMQAWNKGGGKVIKGLVNRRKAEGQLYLTGQYMNDGTVAHIEVNSKHQPVYKGRVSIKEYMS